MTEDEYQKLKTKIEREWPARQKLAKKLGKKPEDYTLLELWAMFQLLNVPHPDEFVAAVKAALDIK